MQRVCHVGGMRSNSQKCTIAAHELADAPSGKVSIHGKYPHAENACTSSTQTAHSNGARSRSRLTRRSARFLQTRGACAPIAASEWGAGARPQTLQNSTPQHAKPAACDGHVGLRCFAYYPSYHDRNPDQYPAEGPVGRSFPSPGQARRIPGRICPQDLNPRWMSSKPERSACTARSAQVGLGAKHRNPRTLPRCRVLNVGLRRFASNPTYEAVENVQGKKNLRTERPQVCRRRGSQ